MLLGIFDEGQADKQINEGIAHVSLSLPLVHTLPFRMAHGVHGGITKHIQVVHIVKFIVIVLV